MTASAVCSIETDTASSGMAGQDLFHAAGPVMDCDCAMVRKTTAREGAAPAAGGKVASPWLL
jgi:hypothetical protein